MRVLRQEASDNDVLGQSASGTLFLMQRPVFVYYSSGPDLTHLRGEPLEDDEPDEDDELCTFRLLVVLYRNISVLPVSLNPPSGM